MAKSTKKTGKRAVNSTEKPYMVPEELKGCETFLTLPPKNQRFILEYLKKYNGTQAGIEAGFSKKTAAAQASRLLNNVNIQKALQEVSEKITTRDIADAQEIREFLTSVMRGNITDVCSWSESGLVFNKHSGDMNPDKTRLVKKVKVTEKTSQEGDWQEVKTELEIHDPLKAAELLGRTLGIFLDKHELTGSVNVTVKMEM